MLPTCVCVKRPAHSQSCSKNIQTSVHSFRRFAFLLSHQTHVWTDAKGTHKSPVSCPEGRCRVPGLWLHTGGWLPGQLHHSCMNGMTAYNWFATLVSFVCTCCSSFWPKHVFVKRWHYVTVWEILTHVWKKFFWMPPKWRLVNSQQQPTTNYKKKGVQNWDENFSHSLCGHKSYVFVFYESTQKVHSHSVCLRECVCTHLQRLKQSCVREFLLPSVWW